MVKPATTSSNTPIKLRGREPSSCSSASSSSSSSSSPDSYHYSTKLRCVPPGDRTSPSPSPTPTPSPSPHHRSTTPPSPTAAAAAAAARQTGTLSYPSAASACASHNGQTRAKSKPDSHADAHDAHGAHGADDVAQTDAPTSTTTPTRGTMTCVPSLSSSSSSSSSSSPPLMTPYLSSAFASALPFLLQTTTTAATTTTTATTPPPRPRNPLAKEKAFTEASPAGRVPLTQELLDALRIRGVGFDGAAMGLRSAECGGGCGSEGEEKREDGEEGKQREKRHVDGENDEERAGHERRLCAASDGINDTNSSPPHDPNSPTEPDWCPSRDSFANDINTIDSPKTTTHALLRHRAHAGAAYEAARLARVAAPEDRAVKLAYIEARAAYDAARRAYANAVMDEEEEEEMEAVAVARRRRRQQERWCGEKGKNRESVVRAGRGMMMGEEEKGCGDEGKEAAKQQPPSPTPTGKKKENEREKKRQRGRIVSPLERLERSVRRMKANRAI